MKLATILLIVVMATAAQAVSYPVQIPKGPEELTTNEGLRLQDVHGTVNPPSIPKTWKLISVSAGEKPNSSNLWFQDADGSVYMLQGFTSQDRFVIHEQVYKIPAK